ncbi:MAG TPA: glutathione S-transferase family protein [Candidatus Thermoplasmatota archaeon]|jgi:glutathione S-transferase|nr:glutathione S-transferase family protein [Candidatus Thermoplasmatota archaeon]
MPAKPAAKQPKVTLYEESFSHHCVKARKLLDFKGITYERREVAYHDKRELLKVSGQDYVPFLQWGSEGVVWHEIVAFLERKVPDPSAFLPGLEGQARILEQWAHDILEERVWRYVVPDFSQVFKDDLERWVFEEIQFWKRGPMEALKAKQPAALDDMRKHVAFVETALADHDYVLGDAPCLADFAVYGALDPLRFVKKELPKEFPRVRAWQQRVGKI